MTIMHIYVLEGKFMFPLKLSVANPPSFGIKTVVIAADVTLCLVLLIACILLCLHHYY